MLLIFITLISISSALNAPFVSDGSNNFDITNLLKLYKDRLEKIETWYCFNKNLTEEDLKNFENCSQSTVSRNK